ncbi:phytoene desaturase family protein [Arthrobacter sp. 35W]|uniref:phytoene desaturase family protein n=1 Tax=Arthrobacter sp. 35W TaxID=1132441 RepID=UPI0004283324|nr:phytoene desaturase family protein [Arthrobacter sp. 35W]
MRAPRVAAIEPGRHIAVVGAGISGLAVAALLVREGFKVTVLEQQDQVGGRAGRWEQDGFRFDTGPSWYLMPEVFDHFFRLLGTSTQEQLDLTTLDPGYRVYFEHHDEPVDVRQGRQRNIALFEGIEPGSGRRLAAYLDSARKSYDLARRHFLYTSFASFLPLLNREVLANVPALLSQLLLPLDGFAARCFRDNRLRQILGYPAVFLGTSPSDAPSLYHLMSHLDLADGVQYPAGGFGTIIDAIEALARDGGARIRTGARVRSLVTENRRGRAAVTGLRFTDGNGEHVLAVDAVVSAADLHHTETALLPRNLQTYPERYWGHKVAGPGALLVFLGVSGPLPRLGHHTLFFAEDWKSNFGDIFGPAPKIPEPASIYVCRPSATDPSTAPEGSENLFVLVPIPADPGLGRGGMSGAGNAVLEALADRVIAQIAVWSRTPDLAERITVRRTVGPGDFATELNAWRGTALGPAHVLRQSAFLRSSNKSAKVDGLYYCGSSTRPGIGLPMCLISAEILLKRLRGDTSTGPLPEPPARRRADSRKGAAS